MTPKPLNQIQGIHSSAKGRRSNSATEQFLIDPDNSVGMLILQPTKQYDDQRDGDYEDNFEQASQSVPNKRKSE